MIKLFCFFSSPGCSEGYSKPCRHEKSPSKSNEVISPEILKMRAALFCIFTYLDTKTLLRAAEVCRDWKFVARHPAVWTRVLLENARISSKVNTPLHPAPFTPPPPTPSSVACGPFTVVLLLTLCFCLSFSAPSLSGARRRTRSFCKISNPDNEARRKARRIISKAHGETPMNLTVVSVVHQQGRNMLFYFSAHVQTIL